MAQRDENGKQSDRETLARDEGKAEHRVAGDKGERLDGHRLFGRPAADDGRCDDEPRCTRRDAGDETPVRNGDEPPDGSAVSASGEWPAQSRLRDAEREHEFAEQQQHQDVVDGPERVDQGSSLLAQHHGSRALDIMVAPPLRRGGRSPKS